MLVTNLVKKALPFIRYELNDVVTIRKEPCHCGSSFRVIESIQGRVDDIFWAPHVSGGYQFIFPDYIRRAIISSSDTILDYRVVQERPDRVVVHLRLEPYADEDETARMVRERLEDVFQEYGCEAPSVIVRGGLPERGRGEKLIRVRRDFEVGEA
jgi:phenylacetate-coenzyme A ligase PaaK-like adenylate-forming protein